MATKKRAWKPPKLERTVLGPYKGMRDSKVPLHADNEWASFLQNVYVRDQRRGGGLVTRPGFKKLARPAIGEAQGLFFVSERSGFEDVFAVVGGGLYKYDWTTATWSGNVKPGGVAINATGKVWAVWFNQRLIVSDGVNRPWAFNPADNTGAYITEMPGAAYGQPVVHGAKLFFIKADDRRTIVWSEELDHNTGYEVISPANRWTLAVTSQEELVRLLPIEGGMYYFRERSVGFIQGSVVLDFATSSTLESVGQMVGTLSIDGVILIDDTVYFVDGAGLPHFFKIGGRIEDLWYDVEHTLRDVNTQRLVGGVFAAYLEEVNAVAWALPLSSGSTQTLDLLLFDIESHACYGLWKHRAADAIEFTRGVRAVNLQGEKLFLHLDADGDFYQLKRKEATDAGYDDVSTSRLPEALVGSPFIGYDDDSTIALDSFAQTMIREVEADYRLGLQLETSTTALAGAGQLVYQVGRPGDPSRVLVGLGGEGRWARLWLSNADQASGQLKRHIYLESVVRFFRVPAGPSSY